MHIISEKNKPSDVLSPKDDQTKWLETKCTSQLSKALPTTKYSPKKMNKAELSSLSARTKLMPLWYKDRIRSKGNCSKLMALQEALQDPITVYEGI